VTEPSLDTLPPARPASLASRTAHGMAWGQLAKTLEVAFTLVIAVIVVRALQPAGFGFYSLLTTFAGVGSVLIPLVTTEALGAVFPRIAERRGRVYLLALVTGLRTAVILLVVAAVVPAAGLLRDTFGIEPVSGRVLLLVGAYWLALDLLNGLAGFFQAELDVRPVALWRTAGQVLTISGLVAIVILAEASVGLVILVVTAGYLLAGGGLAAGLRRAGRPHRPEGTVVRFALLLTRHVWPIGVLSLAMSPQLAVLLIGAVTANAAEVGLFAAAVGIVGRIQILLLSGWSALMIPAFGAARARGGTVGLARPWRLFAQLWLLVAVPLNALLAVTADGVIVTLFGSAYEQAGRLLFWTAVFNLAAAAAVSPPSVGALWALDRQSTLARVRLVAAPVTLAAAALLVAGYGSLGAVVALGAAALGTGLAELALARRAGVVSYPVGFAVKIGTASAAAALPGLVLRPDGPAGLALALALGVLALVAALMALRPFAGDDLDTLGRVSARLARSPLRLLARP
jgi:O-antigen/teichoic acid export membrane protein